MRAVSITAEPTPSPAEPTATYTDYLLGFAFDLPAAWTVDGHQGAEGHIIIPAETGGSQSVLTFSVVGEGNLDFALGEVKRGAWGSHIQAVQPVRLGEFEALRLELAQGEDRPPLVWLVGTPSGQTVGFTPDSDPALVEPVLATLRAVPVRDHRDLPRSALPPMPTIQPIRPPISSTEKGPITPQPGWQIFTSQDFQVTFQYPANWQPIEGYDDRYGGPAGFFQVSALSGLGLTVEEACELEASHHLQPYGAQPQVARLQIQGQDACLILPSADQAQEMKGQAALVVRYPEAVQIREVTYRYFILWTDKDHLGRIAQTLKFGL